MTLALPAELRPQVVSEKAGSTDMLEYYNTFSDFVKYLLRKNVPGRIIALGAVLVGEPAVPCTRNPL